MTATLLGPGPGWAPGTNIYEIVSEYDGTFHIAVTVRPDSTTFGPGQAQAVRCQADGMIIGEAVQAFWWAAGTFTHAEVLDALGY